MSDTVWLALIAGFFGFLNTGAVLFARWLSIQDFKRTNAKVDVVHGIVNQQRTDMMNEIDALKEKVAWQDEVARRLAEHAGPTRDSIQ